MDHVSENDLRKLRAILARAERSPYENEREVSWKAATRLMAKLSISQADLDGLEDDNHSSRVDHFSAELYRPYAIERYILLNNIAYVFSCRAIRHNTPNSKTVPVEVYGTQSDLDMTWALFDSLFPQMATDMEQHPNGSVRFKKSFMRGFVARVTKRIEEFYMDDIREQHGEAGALVLRDRAQAVDELLSTMDLEQKEFKQASDPSGVLAGNESAARADVTLGQRNLKETRKIDA